MASDVCEICHGLIPGRVTCWDRDDNPICRQCHQEIEDRAEHLAHVARCVTDDGLDVS